MENIMELISQLQDLNGQSIVFIKLDRAAEKNGFFVNAIKLDAERNSVPLNAFGYDEETEVIVKESYDNDVDFVQQSKNPGAFIQDHLEFHSNRTRDGIIVTDDEFTDIPFIFVNVGTSLIKVDGHKVASGEFFIETIDTPERKKRKELHNAAMNYVVNHYNDPNFSENCIF